MIGYVPPYLNTGKIWVRASHFYAVLMDFKNNEWIVLDGHAVRVWSSLDKYDAIWMRDQLVRILYVEMREKAFH